MPDINEVFEEMRKAHVLLTKNVDKQLEEVRKSGQAAAATNETVENAGLRELKEETGYKGKLIKVNPFLATCAYLTNEETSIVEIKVDDSSMGATNHEEAEAIIPFWIKKKNFEKELKKFQEKNYIIESNVWFYFKGLQDFSKK